MIATPDYAAITAELGDPFPVADEITDAVNQPLPTIDEARMPEANTHE